MPQTFTEGAHAGEFILNELVGNGSRSTVTLSGLQGVLKPGTVLGKKAADGEFIASPVAVTDGAEVAAAVLVYETDTSAGDAKAVVIDWTAELNGKLLNYAADCDTANERAAKHAQLALKGVKVR